jgi:hypothetical protein
MRKKQDPESWTKVGGPRRYSDHVDYEVNVIEMPW